MTLTRLTAFPVALALLAIGCGGGDSDPPQRTGSSPAVLAKANTACRQFHREVEQIGKGALAGYTPAVALELTSERLVKPSIPILERVARRQRNLSRETDDPIFALYANLFDPIVALSYERLRAGRAGDHTEARRLEELLTELGLEQMQAAHRAGLRSCNVDFQDILLSSLSG